MGKKTFVITIIASTFTTQALAVNNNPATVEYVQSAITSVIDYVTSKLSNIQSVTTYTLGQTALGGTIFYLDSTGTHGLVASNVNGTASDQQWDGGLSNQTPNNDDIIVNATGNGVGAGAINTSLIVGVQSGYAAYLSSPITGPQTVTLSNMAAQFCVNYSAQADGSPCPSPNTSGESCIGNWYLPSLFELNQMYLQRSLLGYPLSSSQDAFIWSSTENDQNNAWRINFTVSNNQESAVSKNSNSGAWCIHSF